MGDDMKFAFAGSLAAVLLASAANGQSAKLVIEPSHGKMISGICRDRARAAGDSDRSP